jgi:hypothetical protein
VAENVQSMRPREVLLSLAVAFGALILDGCFKLIEIRYELGSAQDQESLTLDEMIFDYGLLTVHYDLLLIALGLLATANFSMPRRERHRLNSAWAVMYVATLLTLASVAIWTQTTSFTIGLRNGLALFTIGWTAHMARVG